MTRKLELEQLERQLTRLLGKQSYLTIKKACTGKYRGFYDYGLTFQDGSHIWISTGWKLYARNLREKVEQYQYYRSHHARLEEQTRQVIDCDNRQAASLGLMPVEFVRLELIDGKTSDYAFWVRAVLRHDGRQFYKMDTMFHYACLGFQTEEYFAKKLNRPNEALGSLHKCGQTDFAAIIFGYPYERKSLERQ